MQYKYQKKDTSRLLIFGLRRVPYSQMIGHSVAMNGTPYMLIAYNDLYNIYNTICAKYSLGNETFRRILKVFFIKSIVNGRQYSVGLSSQLPSILN